MEFSDLLKKCRLSLEQSHNSWNEYFLKWESEAKNENVENTVDLLRPRLGRKSTAKKVRGEVKLLKKPKTSSKVKKHGRILKQYRKTKLNAKRKIRIKKKMSDNNWKNNILRNSKENHSELDAINNVHLEARLRAVFTEILSENPTKGCMFTVLSRMISGDLLSNAITSMVPDNNGLFATSLHESVVPSATCDDTQKHGLPLNTLERHISPRQTLETISVHGSTPSDCANMRRLSLDFKKATEPPKVSEDEGNDWESSPNLLKFALSAGGWNDDREKKFGTCLSSQIMSQTLGAEQSSPKETGCNAKPVGILSQSFCFGTRPFSVSVGSSPSDFNRRPIINERSPVADSLRRMFSSPLSSEPRIIPNSQPAKKSSSPLLSRKKSSGKKPRFLSCDDDSEDDSDGTDASCSGCLKISCTPKRRKTITAKTRTNLEVSTDDSEDESFTIFDRIERSKT